LPLEFRCHFSVGRLVVSLLAISFLALAPNNLVAAKQHDKELELLETTYRVTGDDTAEVVYHEKWKALTAQGRADISQLKFPYVASFHDVEIKYIKTIKKDGSVVDGDPTSAFDTDPSQEPLAPVFDDTKYRTVLPPSLETGDSVEVEAVVHVRKWPKSGDFWFAHYLTTSIPVLSEIVVLDLPADRKVALYASSTIPGSTEISNGRRIERWTAANPEPAASSLEESPTLFAVSSTLSWEAFGEWMRSLNENAAAPTPEIAALAAKLTANKSGEQERIAALYAYVATKIRYVSVSFGMGRLQPHTASVVLHNAYGDCKDQAALLSALLKAAGFKTYAVLTTPGAGVRVPDVPMPEFNHEFTALDTKSGLEFLDTSMGPVQPGLLQPGVRGRGAILIGDKTSSIVEIPLQSPVPQRIASTLKGRVTASGNFEGSTRLEFQGFAEPLLRRVFLDATEADKEKILHKLAGPEFISVRLRTAIREISVNHSGLNVSSAIRISSLPLGPQWRSNSNGPKRWWRYLKRRSRPSLSLSNRRLSSGAWT
jgi:transglutaminase-like putative cysteine protease